MAGYVYILRCSDGSWYVGSTRLLHSREFQHQLGMGAAYTRKRLALIAGDYEGLPALSKKDFSRRGLRGLDTPRSFLARLLDHRSGSLLGYPSTVAQPGR